MWRDYKTAQDKRRQSFVSFVPMSTPDPDSEVAPPLPPNPDPIPIPVLMEEVEAPIPMQETGPNPGAENEVGPTPLPIFPGTVNYSEDYMVGGPDNINQNPGFHSGVDAVDSPSFYPPFYGNNKPRRYFEAHAYPPPPPRGSVKRSMQFEGSGIENKKPRVGQTASAIVNEKVPGLAYTFSDRVGPPHDPSFECTVFFPPNDKEYTGTGRSKKLAKCNAAENILEDMGIPIPEREIKEKKPVIQELKIKPEPTLIVTPPSHDNGGQPNSVPIPIMPANPMMNFPPALDFSSDDLPGITPGVPLYASEEVAYIDAKMLKRLGKININQNPCCALNSLLGPSGPTSGPEVNYEFISVEGPPHEIVFQVKLTFKQHEIPTYQTGTTHMMKEFMGTGPSKKKAKADAAKQALVCLIGAQNFAYLQQLGMTTPWATQGTPAVLPSPSPKARKAKKSKDPEKLEYIVFADHVSQLIIDKFASLTAQNEVHATQKVLAGVVMTRGDPLQKNSTIIAVTTGNKCIEGDYMSDQGLALNDCHAEILATRCVRDFLYSQIDLLNSMDNPIAETKPEPETLIFENFGENSEGVTKYRLKEDVKFHLYISTSPCGDARIFSPNGIDVDPDEPKQAPGEESTESVDVDAHPRRINRGLLRAKIEAGEGTIPVANLNTGSGIQTWDAIMQGSALHTMSCSDKVARWNVLGFQGALLSVLMDPIYYASIILGSLHHPVHFQRAMITRLEALEPSIQAPYILNKPRLLMVSKEGKRRVKKSPAHAIAWVADWSAYEAIASSKGRCEPGGVASRLTKRMAFMRFLKLYKNKTGTRDNYADLSYEAAKLLAEDFLANKTALLTHFTEAGLGNWISKPLEQDGFFLK